jgi:hypothetical protein
MTLFAGLEVIFRRENEGSEPVLEAVCGISRVVWFEKS